jgi:RHS repeat-associated protein
VSAKHRSQISALREYDAETGLYHFCARVYDPDVGRFVQSDPIGFAAGDLNLYAYTLYNPGDWSDPSGLALTSTIWRPPGRIHVSLASWRRGGKTLKKQHPRGSTRGMIRTETS